MTLLALQFVTEQGPAGRAGAGSAITFIWDAGTNDADPGDGEIRVNHADLDSATQIFIDDLNAAGGSIAAWIDSLDDSGASAFRGVLMLQKIGAEANFAIYRVTGSVTAASGYRKISLEHIASDGTFDAGDEISLSFSSVAGADFVSGPGSSVAGNLPTFAGVDGVSLLDSGIAATSLAPKETPAFTGNPTAPTQTIGNNTTRLANTAFVKAAIDALLGGAPGALDTLNELAAALGDDENFAATITSALALKENKSEKGASEGYPSLVGGFIPTGQLPLSAIVTYLLTASADTRVLFNDVGVIAGSSGFTFNKASNLVAVSGVVRTHSGNAYSAPQFAVGGTATDGVGYHAAEAYKTFLLSGGVAGLAVANVSGVGRASVQVLGIGSSPFYPDVFFHSDGGILALRNGLNPQAIRIYGKYVSGTDKHLVEIGTAVQTLSAVSGASVTATNIIPDGAIVVGVTTKVTTGLGTGGGTSGYKVGDGSDDDRWGDITGTIAGTSSDSRDWTATAIQAFIASNNVVITAIGGDFNGTGAIDVSVQYLRGLCD